jgi:hypothetical protein
MDMDTIREMNAKLLAEAKEAEGKVEFTVEKYLPFIVAVLVAVAVYFGLRCWKPKFVVAGVDTVGTVVLDQTKLIIAAVVAGLVVLLIAMFLPKFY